MESYMTIAVLVARGPLRMGAVEFLYALEQQLGRKGAIYSGNRIKETISDLDPTDRAYSPLHGEPFGASAGTSTLDTASRWPSQLLPVLQ
jgi:hypothetical protein